MDESPALASPGSSGGEYVVVARRYRPQTFDELIGQEHVARGLSGAILSHRVGHAYLFTGARGVGKTSAARILAKALNCIHGPAPAPCNQCDICRSISSGDDVDVLEIDGASNRGIDEIRQLRQNVNMRPSRARFKVYIIDEVHMLTREAFNALLKTLEEPPEHVKFIFCTTEPEKIPITILSRCQRYDFAGIQADSIARRLRQIAAAEGVEADDDAIALLARRAAGSMRDSQSLLEQLLSLGGKRLTTADVHAMLGTAGGARLDRLVGHLVDHQPAGALAELDTALSEGVDVGQLLDQLLGYFRDVMAAAAGCGAENFLYTDPGGQPQIAAAAQQFGLETILAILQIIEQTLWRLRFSTQARTLAELALVRIAKLDDLERLSDLIAELRSGSPPAPATPNSGSSPMSSMLAKKKADVTPAANGSHPPPAIAATVGNLNGQSMSAPQEPAIAGQNRAGVPLRPENALEIFRQAAEKIGGLTASSAQHAEAAAIGAPNQLVVTFPAKYNYGKTVCEAADKAKQLESVLGELVGSPIRLVFAVSGLPDAAGSGSAEANRPMSSRQREAQLMQNPLVKRAAELFDARPMFRESGSRD
jgi:DNA polymerase III subunit gamma/tau